MNLFFLIQSLQFLINILYHFFRLSRFLLFQVKMINHCQDHVIFQDIEHQLQEISFITFFIIVLYEIFIKLRSIFSKLFTEDFVKLPNHINYLHPNIE